MLKACVHALKPCVHALDARVHVLRSGCAWHELPEDPPSWPVVCRTFRRWPAEGLFAQMHDELHALWRSHERRNAR